MDLLGWVRREEFFDQVDLAVFPSVWEEPFGLVAAEAMARGVPFVISYAVFSPCLSLTQSCSHPPSPTSSCFTSVVPPSALPSHPMI
ncbi:glycosyltransferase [Herbaspirillum sp. VT-16-41]|uniref:glycosyltransferase n=1 Tax=Herbaspirillum sp. VT-16-41 TaxID=1953765 RepID=UPI0009D19064|nr:glycosyltransferase [Herbaspirillum sp. VT-16-41]ONN64044.1 hypothetical protein BTM36_24120 [Herbaspirillum sp. VT-16-41]